LAIYQKAQKVQKVLPPMKSICPCAGNIKETPDICGIKYMTNYQKYCWFPTKIGRKHHRDIYYLRKKERNSNSGLGNVI